MTTNEEKITAACDWADYRSDYSKATNDRELMIEHQAFLAGHKAALHGDQRGVLR